MPFDPALPATHTPISSAELRNQLNGLMDQINNLATHLDASQLTAGVVPDARLAGAVPSLGGLSVSGDATIDGAAFNLVNGASASFNGVTALDSSGALSTSTDIHVTDSNAGIILHSPNGTLYRIKVDDAGVLSTELV